MIYGVNMSNTVHDISIRKCVDPIEKHMAFHLMARKKTPAGACIYMDNGLIRLIINTQ